MASTSKYVQLTPYVLMEYRYTDPAAPEDFSFDFLKIENGHTGLIHLMNEDSADDTTRNVRERSAVKVSNGSYVDTDKDQVPNYLSFDSEFTVTTEDGSNCPYDTIVFHLLAGYNFEDRDGVMFQVEAPERSGKKLILSNIVFLKTSDWFEFNARPVLLGDKVYDRYVSVKVPSIKILNDIFASLDGNPTQPNSLAARLSSDGMAFMRADPLNIKAIEIRSTVDIETGSATYKQYNIGTTTTVSVNQADEFALLGATIQPFTVGDGFEYFATWAGGFIEDYIGRTRGLTGYDYILIHELRVLEQVGSLFTQTSFFQSIQEEGFDQPLTFRPVIENASKAVSFTIDYVMRLYNKADGSQIIRTSSYTDYNAKMWGRSLNKIKLLNEPQALQVYNKVVAGPQLPDTTFINNAGRVNAVKSIVVPAFFDRTIVSVQQDTVQLDSNGQLATNPGATTQPIYGQGDATIVISPFDNYFKITILRTEATENNTPIPLDLGQNAVYYLVFMNNENQKVKFRFIADSKIGDPQAGDLVFKIPGNSATNILSYTTRQFWIVSRFEDTGAETDIYHGEFVTAAEMENKRGREVAASERSTQTRTFETQISDLQKKLETSELQLQAATSSIFTGGSITAIDANATGNNVTRSGVKIPAGTKPEVSNELNIQVPGLTSAVPKDKKTSIVANIMPKVIKPTFKKPSSE